MRQLAAILMLMFLPAVNAGEVYFIDLDDFRKWPPVAQQAYVVGAIEQGLAAAYQYEPAGYRALVACMEKVETGPMFTFVLNHILSHKYNEALTPLVGDGLVEFCEKNGHKIN